MSGAARQASAVGVHCTGGWGWRAVQSLLAGLAASACGLWLLLHLGAPGWPAAAAGVLAAALAWRAARPLQAALQWNGAGWSVDEVPGSLQVMMDLGGWMLLRFVPAHGRRVRWLPLAAGEAGGARHALRVALYARPAAQHPGARPTIGPD